MLEINTMVDYVNEQKQRKNSGQCDSLHTGIITTTSGRRREFRRTERRKLDYAQFKGMMKKTRKMSRHTQGLPLATYASQSVPTRSYTN